MSLVCVAVIYFFDGIWVGNGIQILFLRDNYYRTRLAFIDAGEFRVENQIALIAWEGTLPVVIASRLHGYGTRLCCVLCSENIGELSKYALMW